MRGAFYGTVIGLGLWAVLALAVLGIHHYIGG